MPQYKTGTVNVTNNSPTIIGQGTFWLTNVQIGNSFKVKDINTVYTINSVDSDIQITLSTNYNEVTNEGLEYQIVVDFTPNYDIPEIYAGDVDWPYHLTQALRIIDSNLGKTGLQGLTGQTGLQGPQGVTGPTGPLSQTGSTGPQGVTGLQGVTGTTGNIGPQGVTGTIGTTGQTGLQGTTGIAGQTGPQGSQGLQGLTGPQGMTGRTGLQGIQGTTGNTGLQGPKGDTGPQGIQGSTGRTGAQGVVGDPGPPGEKGVTGIQGVTGSTGPQGVTGSTGPQGIQGVTGPTGPPAGDASEANKGIAELATVAEAIAGTDTSRITTPAGVAAAAAILKNPLTFAQGVNLTAGTSTTNISVADNNSLDMGTNSFTLVFKGSLPDWSPVSDTTLLSKYFDAAARIRFIVAGSVYKLRLYVNDKDWTSSVAQTFTNGTVHEVAVVVTVGAVNTTADFYADGVALGTQQTATNWAGNASTNTSFNVLGLTTSRMAGVAQQALLFNCALTAAEVLDLYRNGINFKHKWGSQTAQTSGTLIIGKEYIIDNWITDDDFTNVGGANVDGTVFVATGTTPTKWTNSSSLRPSGATLALEGEGIQRDGWKDSSTNGNNASYPTSGYSFLRPIRTDSAEGLLSVTNVSLAADADTTIYTVPVGKRLALTKAILVVGADAGTSVISIGADGAETNWLPNNTLSALDAANDAAILVPVPNTTPTLIKSYAGGTVIQAKVSSQAGGATNSLSLFGYLY